MLGGFRSFLLVLATAGLASFSHSAQAACTPVATATALNNIRNNLAGNYCLTANINAASLGNFAPIGDFTHRFTGTLDGAGFAIQNLKIDDAAERTGFFRYIEGGTVKNIRFLNVNVNSASTDVGAVAGQLYGATGMPPVVSRIVNVTVTGKVTGFNRWVGGIVGSCSSEITDSSFSGTVSAPGQYAGGVAGITLSPCKILRSYSAGSVSGGNGSLASVGGLVGKVSSGSVSQSYSRSAVSATATTETVYAGGLAGSIGIGEVVESYATGAVSATSPNSGGTSVGGLVGYNSQTIRLSFATGPVSGGAKGNTGGLVGLSGGSGSAVSDSYSTGPVTGDTAATGGATGGLVGFLGTSGAISRSFSAGKVVGASGKTGGLVGALFNQGAVTQSYWDKNSSGQTSSVIGTGSTTGALRAALPAGFAAPNWRITPQVSYPFLARPGITFWSTLATTVKSNRLYVFLPLAQLDRLEYVNVPAHANKASEAAVYTMLARAIGITKNVAVLKNIKIDANYWDDSTQTTSFNGTVTSHATRGGIVTIPAATPINAANILGKLKANNVVLISGPVPGGTHSMLATSYTVDGGGAVTALIAHDPYTGRQVRINPTTKKVFSPGSFPLTTFKVTTYRVLTLL